MRFLMSYLCVLLAGFSALCAASFATPVAEYCILQEICVEEDWPNEEYGDFLSRCMRYQRDLQPFKKVRSSWGIVTRCCEKRGIEGASVLNNDATTWQNLQLFHSAHKEVPSASLIRYIDRTKLTLGRRLLELWIANPEARSTIDVVKHRQAAVQSLISDQSLFESIEQHLSTIKASENFLLSFFLNDPLYNTANKSYFKYFNNEINDKLNSDVGAMRFSAYWGHAFRLTQFAAALQGSAVLALHSVTPWIEGSYAASFLGAAHAVFPALNEYIASWVPSTALYGGAALIAWKGVTESYCWMRDNLNLQLYMQEKLVHVASAIEAMNAMKDLIEASSLTAFNNISKALEALSNQGSPTSALIDILKGSAFASIPRFRPSPGEVLVAYRLMHEHAQRFDDLLYAVGELDAHMSIARLYKEFESQRVQYAFVSFADEAPQPLLYAQDLWNPFVDPQQVVANTVELGTGKTQRNMVLTGPNEGGKSTFVRGVVLGSILAQSLGIMPAAQALITPFDYIATYLNITDEEGKSLFDAQAERAKLILDHVEGLAPHQAALVSIDEMFNGTHATVGQALAHTYASHIGSFPNVIAFFPTHFPLLTTLAHQENFANYCLAVTPAVDGSMRFSYRIAPGIWERNIALDIMRHKGFSDDFLHRVEGTLQQ